MSQTARVMSGLVAGVVIGIVLAWWDPVLANGVADIVQPFGKLWINALQMTVVPLVLALVIVGVNAASDAASSGRVARRAMIVFLVLLTAAGISNYSIHLERETNSLFGYLERREDHTMADLPNHLVMQRWWAHMGDIMATNADGSPVAADLTETFHLA